MHSTNINKNKSIFAIVLNNLGQVIFSSRIEKNKLDLSHLKDGVYHLIIKTNENQHSKKLIIQN